MRLNRVLLGITGALVAAFSLSSASFAAFPAGMPIVIAPQPGAEVFYYVNVEAPPSMACTVGQKVFFAKLGDGPAGWSWSVDIDGNIMTPLPASDFPAGKNVIAGYTCAKSGVGTVIWTTTQQPYAPESQMLQMTALSPADPDAARTETEEEMNLQCNANHKQGATIDHLWIEGQFVLATWSCGDLHGEYSFRMIGAKLLGQTYVRIGDTTVSVTFQEDELIKNVTLMDRITAGLLVDHQNGAH